MKKLIFAIALIIFTVTSVYVIQQHSLSAKLNRVLEDFGDNVNVGIEIKDPTTGKILYSKNANHYFLPASNQKLLTAAAALETLPFDFTYKTQLFLDSHKIKNGILKDNIYIRFSGDPSFTIEQLNNLVQSMASAGVHKILGHIIIDDTTFDQMSQSPGTSWDDQAYCWGAPVNAIIIEQNCVKATLTPAKQPDQPALLTLPDYPEVKQFINNVITRRSTQTPCITETKPTDINKNTITGCLFMNAEPKLIQMAVNDPRANIQSLIAYVLKKNRITNPYPIEFKKIITNLPLFKEESSLPLSALITTMLKESDNTIANALFKTMGSLYTNATGTFQNGSDAVRHILSQSLQLTIPDTTLIDGSGASRYNYLTPDQLVTLLEKMYFSKYSSFFMQALPISGVDGTLKKRMSDVKTAGKIYAKTGTLTSATTLAGYLHTDKKKILIFSIMINGFVDLPKKYKALEDKICEIIIENS